ncbi:MAG: hypothetical protein KDD91_13445, partial [Caldilinea sp.]|nr:hypothetical protein [Caldilinea sp.]
YLMQDIMSDDVARAPAFGANTALTLPDRRVAAKTGTTNGFKDNWTMGYTPQLTVGVWVGNTDNESMQNVTGLSGAAPIWNAVMRKYHEGLPAQWYDAPPGIVQRVVCQPSGLLPTDQCQEQRAETFVAGTEPTISDNVWQEFEIDRETGLLAGPATPPERIEKRVYEILPQEASDWVRDNGIPQPPTETASLRLEDFDPDSAIISPTLGSYIAGQIEFIGNARGGPYRLEIGQGLEPAEWSQIGPEHGEEIQNGVLERLDTTQLPEGLYTVRLTVNRGDGPKQAAIPVTIDNTPPTVIITEPKPDQLFVMEDDEQININVLANDNLAIGRVEYLIDNSAFVTSTVAPYNERWEIEMRDLNSAAGGTPWPAFESDDPEVQPGTVATFPDGFQAIVTNGGVYFEGHVIKVIGYDAAGNRAESDEVRVYVRHKKK